MTSDTLRRRQVVLASAAAIFGLSVGIALLPLWLRPAPAAQLPGLMTSLGLDARASYRFYLGLVALTLATPALASPLTRRLSEGHAWSFVTATAALASSLWIALLQERLAWVVIPPLVVALVSERLRFVRQRFTRGDLILLPTALCVFIALTDIQPLSALGRRVVISICLVLFVRLALSLLRAHGLRPALCFVASPLAIVLQTHYLGYHQRHYGWPPLVIALLTPWLMRLFVADAPAVRRRLKAVLALAVYPVTILAYGSATSTLAAEGKPHGDLFEDAHNLTVASAMLHGKRPYKDILPPHGLIQDGLLDFLILRAGARTAGGVIKTHGEIGATVSIALYAVTACATGSADAGMAAYFLAASMGTAGGGLRAMPALFGLALIVYAVRKWNPRPLFYASVLVVVAGLTSVDFAAYTAIALLAAIIRFRPKPARRQAGLAAAAGLAVAGGVAVAGLALAGILTDCVRSVLFEVAAAAPAYALTPFAPSDVLSRHRFPPELLVGFLDRPSFPPLFWGLALAGLAVTLAIRRSRSSMLGRWNDALLILAVWVVAAGLSYAQRQHGYVTLLAAPVSVSVATALLVRREGVARFGAGLLILAFLILAEPTAYLSNVDMLRRAHGPLDASLTEVTEVSRAKGVLYRPGDAAIIRIAAKYVDSTLRADETFFDFTNRGALYFLLDRDCPVRQVVVFYERESQQRDIIRQIETNPHVRAALIPRDGDTATMVDAVPNQLRAPLVWEYLRQHFQPDFEQGDVIFWRRIDR